MALFNNPMNDSFPVSPEKIQVKEKNEDDQLGHHDSEYPSPVCHFRCGDKTSGKNATDSSEILTSYPSTACPRCSDSGEGAYWEKRVKKSGETVKRGRGTPSFFPPFFYQLFSAPLPYSSRLSGLGN